MPPKHSTLAVKPEAAAECRAAMEQLLFKDGTPSIDRFALLAKNPEWSHLLDVHAQDFHLDTTKPDWYAGIQKEQFLVVAVARLNDPDAQPLMNTLREAMVKAHIPVGFESFYDVVYERHHRTHSEPRGIDTALQHMPTEHVTRLLGHAPTPTFAAAVARRLTPPAPPAPAKPSISDTPSEGDARSEEVLGAIDAAHADPGAFLERVKANPRKIWADTPAISEPNNTSPKGSAR